MGAAAAKAAAEGARVLSNFAAKLQVVVAWPVRRASVPPPDVAALALALALGWWWWLVAVGLVFVVAAGLGLEGVGAVGAGAPGPAELGGSAPSW